MSATWRTQGFAYSNNASLSTTQTVHAVTRDVTNAALSGDFPSNCYIDSVEIFLTSMSTGGSLPTEVTVYLARDSTGDIAITPGGTTGATQTIETGFTANTGSVVYTVGSDFNFDASTGYTCTRGTLYAVVKLDVGTATADVRVNWRGL